jgi:hypothetical protein
MKESYLYGVISCQMRIKKNKNKNKIKKKGLLKKLEK